MWRPNSPSSAAGWILAAATLAVPLQAAPRGERERPITVTVEELPGEDVWHVFYQLSAPAQGLELVRPGGDFRAAEWVAAAHGGSAVWHRTGSRDRLCFSQPTDDAAVTFRSRFAAPPGELPLALRFGDGARLLSTGHLLVRPLASCTAEAAEPQSVAAPNRFRFRTQAGRTVRVLDAAAAGELHWQPADEAAAATYAVFGEVAPEPGEHVVAVLDPDLPPWLSRDTARHLPALVERLARVVGVPPASRPLALVAWDDRQGEIAATAVRLPRLVVVAAAGGGGEETPGAAAAVLEPLARELLALWAGERLGPDEESAWLAEAAPAALALEAVTAAGLVSEAEAGRRLVAAANDCLVRLGGRGILAVAASDEAVSASCGAVVLAAAGGTLAAAPGGLDLGRLVHDMFAESAAAGGVYGTGQFLGWLDRLGGDRDAVARLQHLLRQGVPTGADGYFRDLLARAGVAARVVPLGDVELAAESLRTVVARAAGRCYCGEGGCDAGEVASRVVAVGGAALATAPDEALARLRAAMAHGSALAVDLDDEQASLFCDAGAFDPSYGGLLEAEPRE